MIIYNHRSQQSAGDNTDSNRRFLIELVVVEAVVVAAGNHRKDNGNDNANDNDHDGNDIGNGKGNGDSV